MARAPTAVNHPLTIRGQRGDSFAKWGSPMARKWEIPEAGAGLADRTDEQVRRLREMLAMMAPEPGTSALGAASPGAEGDRVSRRLMLPSPRAIGDL
jgi:hypothetical protein